MNRAGRDPKERSNTEVRTYTAPVLHRYGTLQSLTKAVGMSGMPDAHNQGMMMQTNS